MKQARVVISNSNNVRVEVQGGATGAMVFLLSVVVGVIGAVKICQIFGPQESAPGTGTSKQLSSTETRQ